MSTADTDRGQILLSAFRMPMVQTIVGRKSSITNAFVNAIIPVVQPTAEEIGEALDILAIDPLDLRCIYCGDLSSEWDHLRPLVVRLRPTGYISEIANLVPACGKCNQSKGNKEWRLWMASAAKRSPTGRGIDVVGNMARLEAFERWRTPICIDFESVVGPEVWTRYWSLYDEIVKEMRDCQDYANVLRDTIAQAALHHRTA